MTLQLTGWLNRSLIPALTALSFYGTPSFAQNTGVSDVELVPITGGAPASSLIESSALIDLGGVSSWRPGPPRTTPATDVIWSDKPPLDLGELDADGYLHPYLAWSIPELERYTGTMSDDAYGWTILGVRYYQTNQLEKSLAALTMARKADPNYDRSAEIYSAILIYAGDLERSQKELLHMLAELPLNPVLRFNAACGYALKTNITEALYHLSVLTNTGWQALRYHLHDPDLDTLRNHPAFQQLAGQQDQIAQERVLKQLRPPLPRP